MHLHLQKLRSHVSCLNNGNEKMCSQSCFFFLPTLQKYLKLQSTFLNLSLYQCLPSRPYTYLKRVAIHTHFTHDASVFLHLFPEVI